jgi:hypothetical protein
VERKRPDQRQNDAIDPSPTSTQPAALICCAAGFGQAPFVIGLSARIQLSIA